MNKAAQDKLDIALAFIRDCAGYKNASIRDVYRGGTRVWFDYNEWRKGGMKVPTFEHSSLATVMKYAVKWCDKTGQPLDITYSPLSKGFCTNCAGVDDFDETLTVAIMKVCVKAQENMK